MTMTLPPSEAMTARPVWARLTDRRHGEILAPPTEEEKADAIRVLREVHVEGYVGWWMSAMQVEAERIMDEAGR